MHWSFSVRPKKCTHRCRWCNKRPPSVVLSLTDKVRRYACIGWSLAWNATCWCKRLNGSHGAVTRHKGGMRARSVTLHHPQGGAAPRQFHLPQNPNQPCLSDCLYVYIVNSGDPHLLLMRVSMAFLSIAPAQTWSGHIQEDKRAQRSSVCCLRRGRGLARSGSQTSQTTTPCRKLSVSHSCVHQFLTTACCTVRLKGVGDLPQITLVHFKQYWRAEPNIGCPCPCPPMPMGFGRAAMRNYVHGVAWAPRGHDVTSQVWAWVRY